MTALMALSALVLLVLAAAQIIVLTVPALLVLSAPTAPTLAAISAQLMHGLPILALLAAVLASVVLGTVAALSLWRLKLWGLAAGLLIAPLFLGTALMAQGTGPESLIILLAGHASQGLAIGTICGLLGLQGVDIGVLRASWCCGVAPFTTVQRVLLPIMTQGILAGALLSALASIGLSLVAALQGPPGHFAALQSLPPPLYIAAAGIVVLLAAITGGCVVLLRRP